MPCSSLATVAAVLLFSNLTFAEQIDKTEVARAFDSQKDFDQVKDGDKIQFKESLRQGSRGRTSVGPCTFSSYAPNGKAYHFSKDVIFAVVPSKIELSERNDGYTQIFLKPINVDLSNAKGSDYEAARDNQFGLLCPSNTKIADIPAQFKHSPKSVILVKPDKAQPTRNSSSGRGG
jgi:hypothetical protein